MASARGRCDAPSPSPSSSLRPRLFLFPPSSPPSAYASTVCATLEEDDHSRTCYSPWLYACPSGVAISYAVPRARGMTRSSYHETPISP